MMWLTEMVVFGGYVLAGPVAWVLYGVGMRTGLRRLRLLGRAGDGDSRGRLGGQRSTGQRVLEVASDDVPGRRPRVLVVVPARNEEGNIEACVRSVLGQEGVALRVIAIEDASADGTGAILEKLARENGRVKVVRLAEGKVPPGWTGKCWAIHRGLTSRDIAEEFLLFVDSDVRLEPRAVRLAVDLAVAGRDGNDPVGHGLVSLLLRQEMEGVGQRALVPLTAATVVAIFGVAYANNDHLKRHAFACGQFMLIRPAVYAAVGGHQAIRGELAEDVELARRVKSIGGRPRVAEAGELGCVRQHGGTRGAVRQWARNLYGTRYGRPWGLIGAAVFLVASVASVLPACGWAICRVYVGDAHSAMFPAWAECVAWWTAVGIHAGLMTVLLGETYAAQGLGRTAVWRALLGIALLSAVLGLALWHCVRGKMTWRGRVVGAA